MEKNFLNIFKAFFKIGALLLGGGYVILPLLTSELVAKRKWITSDKLYEYFALSSSLPGIIAANTAVFTGRELLGTKGAFAAILGVTLPAFIAITLIAAIFDGLVNLGFIQNIFWGVGIGVITLLFLAVREMWSKCVTDKFSLLIFIICLIMAFLKISPAVIVIFAIFAGIIYQMLKMKGDVRNA